MTNRKVGTMDEARMRCPLAGSDPLYQRYHDTEWGRPVTDDTRLFEKICLEGFQSGLSWLTILRKRDNFRAAFAGFDIDAVAGFGDDDIARLLADAGIVRHRGKIVSTINNARHAQALRDEFGSLAAYFWRFEPPSEERPAAFDWEVIRTIAISPTSTRLSKDLRKRGFSFVGPTTCYAFMQAMGMVNDHTADCHCRAEIELARRQFERPGA
jgi:DNA-3-methyladenine glycosylase I